MSLIRMDLYSECLTRMVPVNVILPERSEKRRWKGYPQRIRRNLQGGQIRSRSDQAPHPVREVLFHVRLHAGFLGCFRKEGESVRQPHFEKHDGEHEEGTDPLRQSMVHG